MKNEIKQNTINELDYLARLTQSTKDAIENGSPCIEKRIKELKKESNNIIKLAELNYCK